jgi:hypothetical protein
MIPSVKYTGMNHHVSNNYMINKYLFNLFFFNTCSVGALLWEIAELKKPHSDLNKSEILVGIRKRVSERYCLPFSDGIPDEWKYLFKSCKLNRT